MEGAHVVEDSATWLIWVTLLPIIVAVMFASRHRHDDERDDEPPGRDGSPD